MSSTGHFKVIKASAGSGKTYALVKEFLLLTLRTSSPHYYKHILAITFTNAAAAEMKERVIQRLADFIKTEHSSPLFDEIALTLDLPKEELQQRAKNVFAHMLHHYGMLSILTIDSFTHKLIRSFSRDLHLRYDFTIEMETSAFLEQVVDLCVEDVGKDKELTHYLERFAFQKIEDGKSWDIRKELVDIAKNLLEEKSTEPLLKIAELSFTDFNDLGKKLRSDNKLFESELMAIGQEAIDLVAKNGLIDKDFYQGAKGPIGYFKKISKGTVDSLGAYSKTVLTQGQWLNSKPEPSKVSVINGIVPQLTNLLEKIHEKTNPESLGIYHLRNLIRRNIDSLGLIQRLSEISIQLKESNNLLLISDFHKLINEVVKDNEAPFIYERIGIRYKNILIDEFQDTSVMQWSNALPLFQNALSENNLTLLVGDAKQAIYRWRGGDVTQFIQLPALAPASTPHGSSNFLSSHFAQEILDDNYRSSKEVIAFNNHFYTLLANSLGTFQEVYADVNQNAKRNSEGYVHVETSEAEDIELRWEKTSELIRHYIEESLASGFKPNDIAILTHKGVKEAGKVAGMLTDHGYQVVTKESFLINHSPVVRAVIAYFDIQSNPEKKFAPIELVRSLAAIHPHIHFENFITEYTQRDGRDIVIRIDSFLENTFGDRSSLHSTLSVFSQAMMLLRYFNLEADSSMEFLLAKIQDRCIVQKMPLASFLQWWHDQKDRLYTAGAQNDDSIQIMTVHKSKGLQFPVVIYPRFKSSDRSNDVWISIDEKKFGLPTALVTARRKSAKVEDTIQWPEEFLAEENSSHLDDVNTCYVATTRAEERLYMIQEAGCAKWLSKEITDVLSTHYEGFTENGFWESGVKEARTAQKKEISVDTIRYTGTNYLQPQLRIQSSGLAQNENKEYGNRLHLCLAEMTTASDLERAVKKTMSDLSLHDEKLRESLTADLQKILSEQTIAQWFSPGLKIILERDICLADGKVVRPDRVIIYHDHIDIIDYKTGSYSETHEEQVRAYMTVMREMYPLVVRGFLVYTQGPEVNVVM